MSSDLLRRAAKTLREHAEAASPGAWMAASHTGRKDGVALVGQVAARGTGRAIAVLAGTNVRQRHADAHFVALMHPPVALALADLLDAAIPASARGHVAAEVIALARAILREDAS